MYVFIMHNMTVPFRRIKNHTRENAFAHLSSNDNATIHVKPKAEESIKQSNDPFLSDDGPSQAKRKKGVLTNHVISITYS